MFEAVIVVLIVLVLIGIFSKHTGTKKSTKKSSPNSSGTSAPKTSVSDEVVWLKAEWKKIAEAHTASTLDPQFPKWYFDEATVHQLKKLESLQVEVSGGQLTKGQASDLIGLHSPIDDEDQEVLKFFKAASKNMSQTRGRYSVRQLLTEPARLEQWENRPATPLQKEFYRFFGMKIPTGLTTKDAAKTINAVSASEDEAQRGKLDNWTSYEDIINDLSADKETLREEFDLKKPTISIIREAVEDLIKEGEKLADLSADEVADKIKELRPEMEVAA